MLTGRTCHSVGQARAVTASRGFIEASAPPRRDTVSGSQNAASTCTARIASNTSNATRVGAGANSASAPAPSAPDADPADTGSVAGDLQAWVEQYRDEMSSDVGLGMMLDVLSAKGGSGTRGRQPVPCLCVEFTTAQIEAIAARGISRGDAVPDTGVVMDSVVSPIIYRSLSGPAPLTSAHAIALVAACMKTARKRRALAA